MTPNHMEENGLVEEPPPKELKAAHCWEGTDRVSGQPEVTAYRRRLRLRQARWREAHGLPIGHQPMKGGPGARKLGSRIELEHARRSRANLLTEGARKAAIQRIDAREKYQALNVDRLWADLLSSMPLVFNLLGELQADLALANQAIGTWWPDTPGNVSDVRFEWSPGRRDAAYLGNQSAFDAAVILELPGGKHGVLGIETKYHEWARPEPAPKKDRLDRYLEVSQGAGLVAQGSVDEIIGGDLQQLWIDHLLALSMTQHPEGEWGWARFVVVYPAENVSFADATVRYQDLLADPTTFSAKTLEELLAPGLLPTGVGFADRYLKTS